MLKYNYPFGAMIETRRSPIHTKRLGASDLRKIASILNAEFEELSNSHKSLVENKKAFLWQMPECEFRITTKGGVEYQADLPAMLKGDLLETKVVWRAIFRLSYSFRHFDIDVDIADSEHSDYPSSIEIRGEDSTWVNGMFGKLTDAVNSLENQSSLRRYRWLLSAILALLCSYTLSWLLSLPLENDVRTRAIVFSMIASLAFISTLFLLENYFLKLWPDVEIIPHQPHERKLDIRRRRLKWVFTAIIIPFAISAAATWLMGQGN
jgi:hypothetical protein